MGTLTDERLTDERLADLVRNPHWTQAPEKRKMAAELLALRKAYAELQERYDLDINSECK